MGHVGRVVVSARQVAALVGDAEGGEPKASGRDAGLRGGGIDLAVQIVGRVIKDLPGHGAHLLPEVKAALLREGVEKTQVGGGWIEGAYRQGRRGGGSGRGSCLWPSAATYGGCNHTARRGRYRAHRLAAADSIYR